MNLEQLIKKYEDEVKKILTKISEFENKSKSGKGMDFYIDIYPEISTRRGMLSILYIIIEELKQLENNFCNLPFNSLIHENNVYRAENENLKQKQITKKDFKHVFYDDLIPQKINNKMFKKLIKFNVSDNKNPEPDKILYAILPKEKYKELPNGEEEDAG